jgi:hypothetical protein
MSNVKNYHEQGGMKWVVEGELEIAVGGKLTFQGKELKPAANIFSWTALTKSV